jgi:hypothetical protein
MHETVIEAKPLAVFHRQISTFDLTDDGDTDRL